MTCLDALTDVPAIAEGQAIARLNALRPNPMCLRHASLLWNTSVTRYWFRKADEQRRLAIHVFHRIIKHKTPKKIRRNLKRAGR
jgi:hypothetical protein